MQQADNTLTVIQRRLMSPREMHESIAGSRQQISLFRLASASLFSLFARSSSRSSGCLPHINRSAKAAVAPELALWTVNP